MTLPAGTRLGPYEITAPIGAGGMGEVYRAIDSHLKRSVAIKVLPESFALDGDRVARFTREAQVLASLNHPNIAAIYGIESGSWSPGGPGSSATQALVMELVEGEDLSAHIARGAMPLSEALPIAKQIAEALEAAHEAGIVHRDLKPQNIKVRADGTVKVLDFGLAKAMDSGTSGPQDSNNSPTLTARATQIGMIIGTAAYMAPEQARGRSVDRRADIWAFGVVVYEMLAGRRAFEGDDISITLASVLKEDVRWDALPEGLPAPMQKLLRRCLEKDPKRRLSWIGEARLTLEDPATLTPEVAPSSSPLALAPPPIPRWRRALPWAIAGVCALGFGAALSLWAPWRTAPVPTPRKLLASIGADASVLTGFGASAILSPDGTTLVFVGQPAGRPPQLYIRKLDQLSAAPLAGTENVMSPFFSPDGQWIAFFAGGKLKKVSVNGGAAVTLCDAPNGRGGTWADDDTIIFSPNGTQPIKLLRVAASGGAPAEFGTFSEGGTTQRWPQALPGGKAVLYTEHNAGSAFDGANLAVAPLAGGGPKIVVRGAYYGRYVPSGEDGHLLYMQQGTLFAQPFNLDRLETTGQAVPALEGLAGNAGIGGAQLAFAGDGTLVYVAGTVQANTRPLDWMTRDGKTSTLRAVKDNWANPSFSPDGQKVALDISDGKQRDIWVYEWARDTLTQLTFAAGDDRFPVWAPDGKRITFASDRVKEGVFNLYWGNADGTGEPTRLTDSPNWQVSPSWHPSGRFLVFMEIRGGATGNDLMVVSIEGDAARGWTPGKPTVFLATPFSEVNPVFSPDGRFLAYSSNESGTLDIYVRSFPAGGKWRISTDGGNYPAWSAASRELLFLSPSQKVMFAPYTVVGDSFKADKAEPWSPTGFQSLGGAGFRPYAIHPDGKRLAIAAAEQAASSVVQDKVVFISNFFDYLRKIAPVKK